MEILVWLGRRIKANQRIPNPCRQKYIRPQCITPRKNNPQTRRVISPFNTFIWIPYFSGDSTSEYTGITYQKNTNDLMSAKRNII